MRELRRRRPAVRRLAIAAMALSIAWAPGPAAASAAQSSSDLATAASGPTVAVSAPGTGRGRPPSSPPGPTDGADGPGPARGPLAGAAACDAVPGRYLVRFAGDTPQRGRAAAVARAHGRGVRSLAIVPGLELVASSLLPAEAMAALRTQPDVESVEPDCIVKLDQAPNDPGFGQQWALANTGQTGGSAGADIDALGAWSVRTDAGGVTVGIIDTGMQLNHPDLAANVWTNVDEVAGNGIDDDLNGYVDDVHGWDFVNNDALPADDNGHGTHVAGTIGARGNNGVGVTGVAWTVKLMPLKAFDANGSGSVSAIIAALGYAVENGARVSNHSYGATDFVRAEYDAFVAATTAGHVAFAAAGNNGVNSDEAPHYPAAFRIANVVSVGATTETDEIAGFSNFGIRTVQVTAPGTSILSTLPGSGYGYLDGTSMATPHVAGVAALVAARNPTWTGSQIRDRILGTTRSVAGLSGKAWTGGVVDAGAALSNVATVLPPPFPSATPVALATTIDAAQVPDPVAAPTPPTFPTESPVETSIADVGPPKIAIDAAGLPMIAYTRRMQGVQLLSRSGPGWTDRMLTTAYDDFYWLDLAVNGSGVPTVAVQRAWSNLAAWSDPGIVLVGADAPTPIQQRITAACPDADTCFWDWNPAVAYDAAGKAHVVFTRTAPWDQDMVIAPGGNAADISGTGAYYATNVSGAWLVRRLTDGDADGPAAIAVETDGSVHIVLSRRDGSNSGLAHLTNETGSWTSRLITDHVEDRFSSIGVDGGGGVHIVFARPGLGLYYSYRAPAGTWDAPLWIFDGNAYSPDLAMDSTGRVHVAYGLADGTNTAAGVGYATNRSGSWVRSTVAGGQAHDPSLAVDAAGKAHLAYLQAVGVPFGIHYATNATGSFVSTPARASSDIGALAFATDPLGHHHVAFAGHYGETSAGLYYGTDASGSWVVGRISSAWPTNVALAVDGNGRAHVAFSQQQDANNQTLPTNQQRVGYATNASGSWVVEKASPGADFAAAGVAIALDAAGSPVIVHANAVQSKLLRIRRVGGAWTTDTMYNGIAIREPSILLDPAGALQAAIAARATTDGSGTRIVHVRGTTGAWAVTSVTNGATVRLVPSIGRTADGTIWVAEWEVDQGVRVHRRNPSTGSWTETTISEDPAAVLPTLTVDAAGLVHVAYSNANFYGSAGCSVPECAEGPGLLHAVLVGSTWQTTRLTPRWQDTSSVLARGADGGLSVAFLRTGHGIRLLELIPGKPAATVRLRAASDTGVSPSDGITNAPVLTWDVTFNRPVTGLSEGDFTRTGTATGCVVGTPTGSGATWAISLSGCSTGTVAFGLKAGSVADAEAVAGPISAVAAATVTVDRSVPTAAPPTATLRAGATLSGTNLPVRLAWTGADAGGAGIARYEAARSLNGSSTWTALSSSLATPVFDLLAGPSGTVRYRVRTIDRAGNVGAWATGSSLAPLLLQQTSSSIRKTGTWSTSTSTSYSGGSTGYAKTAGASASYTFTGRSVAYVASRSTTRGKVKVYVNGAYLTTVDLYGSTRHRVVIWQATWSTAATRTIKLVAVGTAGRPRIDLDAFAGLR